jgi:predicted MFS family arabinose efflux permease
VFANNVAATALAKAGWRAAFFVSGPLIGIWSVVLLAVLPTDGAAGAPAKQSKAKAAPDGPPPSALSIPGVSAAAVAYTLTKCALCPLPYGG